MAPFAVIGTVVDTTEDWKLRIIENCLIVVGKSGKIVQKCKNTEDALRDFKERYDTCFSD